MDFVKLRELPKVSATIAEDTDTRRFKSYKKRSEVSLGTGSDVTAMCFSSGSESSQLSVACGTKVVLYEIKFGEAQELASWAKHKNMVHCLAYRRDGKLLVAGDEDGSANIYDVSMNKAIIRRLRGHSGAIYATVFCPNSTYVATCGKDQTVKLWDVPTGQIVHNLSGHSDSVRALLAVNEEVLISAGADGRIIFWDIRSGSQISTVLHGAPVERLAEFGSGAMFFSIGGGQTKLWDTRSMSEIGAPNSVKHTKPVTCAQVSGCGDFLMTSSFDMTVKVIRINGWKVVASFACANPVTAFAWSEEYGLCIGQENSGWILRQSSKKPEDRVDAPTIAVQPKYYLTKDLSTSGHNIKFAKEANVDRLFRQFEYKKLVDFVVETNANPSTALAVLDELIQRGGLVPALRDRTVDELIDVLNWCGRNLVSDPRISIGISHKVMKTLIESNARVFASIGSENPKLLNAVKVLNGRISQEATLQYRAAALAGLLDTVVSI